MKRTSMLQLLKEGWSEHDLVRAKWADIVTILELGKGLLHPKSIEVEADNCAYCELHYENECRECPIKAETFKIKCYGTPFHDFNFILAFKCEFCRDALEKCNDCKYYPKLLNSAWAEYKFLLSLKVEGHVQE